MTISNQFISINGNLSHKEAPAPDPAIEELGELYQLITGKTHVGTTDSLSRWFSQKRLDLALGKGLDLSNVGDKYKKEVKELFDSPDLVSFGETNKDDVVRNTVSTSNAISDENIMGFAPDAAGMYAYSKVKSPFKSLKTGGVVGAVDAGIGVIKELQKDDPNYKRVAKDAAVRGGEWGLFDAVLRNPKLGVLGGLYPTAVGGPQDEDGYHLDEINPNIKYNKADFSKYNGGQ